MSVYSMYFSPTGGTKKVMDLLAGQLGEYTVIDLCSREEDFGKFQFEKDDVCLIGVPSYGGRVPETALERIRRMKAGNAAAVLVAVYGNRAYDDTLLELEEEALKAGYRVIAAVAAVAEHSIMHEFAKGRPDSADEEELAGFAAEIKKRLEEGSQTLQSKLPGNHPYREYKGVPLKPSAGKECNKCGLCARECPTGAIPEADPSKTDTDQCISCMRCISICPNQARSLNKMLLFGTVQKLKKACESRKTNELFL